MGTRGILPQSFCPPPPLAMRTILLLPLLALSSTLPAPLSAQLPAQLTTQLTGGLAQNSKTSLLLLIEGNAQALQVKQVWRKAVPFLKPLQDDKHMGEIVLHDLTGAAVYRQRIDLSDFLGAGAKDEVTGDVVLQEHIVTLIKIPDLGQRLASLELRVRHGKTWTKVGQLTAGALNQLLAPQFQPMAVTVKTHLKSGPVGNRYDIVILGDGYQLKEQTRFYADVAKWMNNLFSKEPYKTYKPFFNVHSVFNPSKESGADQPDRTPPIVKNTVYDASYNTGGTPRCLYIKNRTQALKDAALAPDVEGRVVVFVNDSRYGGCASTFSVSYNGGSGAEVQSHEFGHSFGRLADEYNYGRSGTYNGPEPGQANITADKTGKAKWPLWMGYMGISTYEGAGYYKKGLYRAETNCLMRALGRGLCHICIEEVTKQGYNKVNPIEKPNPVPGPITLTVPAKKTISFSNLVPGGGKIEWKVGGKLMQTGGTSFVLDSSKVAMGLSDLELILTDDTKKVRKGTPVRKAVWKLKILDPNAADLAIKSFIVPSSAPNGSKISIVTTLENKGKTTTGAFELEHFVSRGVGAGPSSTYLGAVSVPAIGPGKNIQIKRSLAIPYYLLQGKATILAYADRAQIVREGERNNNQASTTMTLTAPPGCPLSLEFSDPMVWPATKSKIKLSRPSLVNMRVTAACNKGGWVMVLWSTKGTSPGFSFGKVAIPLNYDPIATPFSIAMANTGPFYLFFAMLDWSGQTKPLIFTGGAFNIRPFSSHFAAVVIKGDFSAITRASNPVQLDFVK